jgi:hypothetical protein
LDNAAGKAVLDLLTAHGVIMDDSLVTSITSRWDATVPPGRAIIIIIKSDGGIRTGFRRHLARMAAYARWISRPARPPRADEQLIFGT